MSNKNSINKRIGLMILAVMIISLLSFIALAIPNSLTLQGKLTNLAGTSQVDTFNFTFRIYDAATAGNELWASANQSVTTDVNGIYDVILNGLNLTFADQYYLGIAVGSDNESTPRINLTSAPYSFRANTSEALNPNQSFVVRNLSITGNATIGDGTTTLAISTQGFNLTTIGNVFIGRNLSVAGNSLFVDGLNQRVGIGTASPYNTLTVVGSISANSINATSINATERLIINNTLFVNGSRVGIGTSSPVNSLHIVTTDDAGGFRLEGADNPRLRIFDTTNNAEANIQVLDSSILIGSASNHDVAFRTNNVDKMFLTTSGNLGINTSTPANTLTVQGTLNITSQNTRSGDLFVNPSGNVGIGTTAPGQALHVVGTANLTQAVTLANVTIARTVINTTQDNNQNLTISSAAGSVIIRLG